MSVYLINEGESEGEPGSDPLPVSTMSEASTALIGFWPKVTEEIRKINQLDVRIQALPLARIKKIMKLDEEVKMISAEAPVLFAKAAELFIHELTLRAWIHTEDNKRRTLQRNDIAMAITKYDQFDFLIDIVPREEGKPPGATRTGGGDGGRAAINADQVHYYFQLAQQHQAAIQGGSAPQAPANPLQVLQPLQVTQNDGATPQGGIQILQQVVTPSGEIQQVPLQLSAAQLQMIRMQLSGAQGGPIILQQPQVIQVPPQNTGAPQTVFIPAQTGQPNQASAAQAAQSQAKAD